MWMSFQLDEPVRQAVVQSQGKGWKKSDDYRFKTGVRRFGDWPWIMLAGGVGIGISWKLKKREWIRILAAAMIASTLAGILANSLAADDRPHTTARKSKNPPRLLRAVEGRTPDRRGPAIQFVSLGSHGDRVWLCRGDPIRTVLAGRRGDCPRLADRMVQHHGRRPPPLRCRRCHLYFALCGVVQLEMDRDERRGLCAQGMVET